MRRILERLLDRVTVVDRSKAPPRRGRIFSKKVKGSRVREGRTREAANWILLHGREILLATFTIAKGGNKKKGSISVQRLA